MRAVAKSNLPFLLAFLLLEIGALRVSACQYCEMASDPSLRFSLLPTDPAPTSTPTAASSAAPPPAWTKLPPPVLSPASAVVTQVSELPKTTPLAAKLAARRSPPPSVSPDKSLSPATKATAINSATASTNPAQPGTHLADTGLLAVAAMGGVFYWRTRRTTRTGA